MFNREGVIKPRILAAGKFKNKMNLRSSEFKFDELIYQGSNRGGFPILGGTTCDMLHKSLFGNDGHTLEAFAEAMVLLADLRGQAIAEFLEELSDIGMFFRPIRRLDAQ